MLEIDDIQENLIRSLFYSRGMDTAWFRRGMAGNRERVLAAGWTGYIEKPIDPETFLVGIEQHLLCELNKVGNAQ